MILQQHEPAVFIQCLALQAQSSSLQLRVPALAASQVQQNHSRQSTHKKHKRHSLPTQHSHKPYPPHNKGGVTPGQVALNGRSNRAAWPSPCLALPTGRLNRAAQRSPGLAAPNGSLNRAAWHPPGPKAPNGSKPLLIILKLPSQQQAV